MVTDELNACIDAIYVAALDPARWPHAMSAAIALFGGGGGGLTVLHHGRRYIFASRLSETAVRQYGEYYGAMDSVLATIESEPVGTVVGGDRVLWPRLDSEFCVDWALPNAMGDGVFVKVGADDHGLESTTFVAATDRGTVPFCTPEREQLAVLLLPHLRRAVATGARLAELRTALESLDTALDHVGEATLVVDRDGIVEHANAAARRLLSAAGPLGIDGAGRLTCPAAQGELSRAVREATVGGVHGRRASTLPPVPAPGRALSVQVVPVPAGPRADPPAGRPTAVVTVTAIGHRPRADGDARERYGFTAAETRVADLLVSGATVADIAGTLFVSTNTVRTHLRHLFEKTGTGRQAELVAVLTGTAGKFFE